MKPAEREKALAYLEKTRQDFRRTATGLSPAQLHYKPAPDRWSLAELFEHIIVVEGRVYDRMEKALQQQPTDVKSSVQDETILRLAADRSGKLKAPDLVVPSGRWPADRLTQEFEATRNRSVEFARTTAADLRRHSFPHPFFGELDCYQWLLLIPAHCQRHLSQAEEVMSHPNFPRAAAAS